MKTRYRAEVEARQLTVENMEDVEAWCGGQGSIKGTLLPAHRRVLQVHGGGSWTESEAVVGDWVVRLAEGDRQLYQCLTHADFELVFSEIREGEF